MTQDTNPTTRRISLCSPCTQSHSYWYRGLAYLFPDGTQGMVLKKLMCELGFAIPFFEIPAFTILTGVYAREQSFGQAFAQVTASARVWCRVPLCASDAAPVTTYSPLRRSCARIGGAPPKRAGSSGDQPPRSRSATCRNSGSSRRSTLSVLCGAASSAPSPLIQRRRWSAVTRP